MRILIIVLFTALLVGAEARGQSTPPQSGFRAEFLMEMEDYSGKLVALAEAIPAEKFSWRPGEGVRSISEAFMHIADANYFLPRVIGTPSPEGYEPWKLEKQITQKEQVITELKESFEFLRNAIHNIEDSQADQEVKFFGNTVKTYRGILLFMTRHTSEHVGQLIAYARMNKVVPPWSGKEG